MVRQSLVDTQVQYQSNVWTQFFIELNVSKLLTGTIGGQVGSQTGMQLDRWPDTIPAALICL